MFVLLVTRSLIYFGLQLYICYIPRYTAGYKRNDEHTYRREYEIYKALNVVVIQKGVDDESERESVYLGKNYIDAESACRTTFAQNVELSITIQNHEFFKFRVCRFMMEQVL